MATTSVPAAKAALLAELQGASALAGVQVSYAHPGDSIQQESIYLTRVVLDEVPTTTGNHHRESYTVEIVVDVARDGDDAQAAETRMWTLVGAIEDLLRPVPQGTTLGGAVNLWAIVEHIEQTPYIEQGQRLSEAVISVRCRNSK